MVNFETEVFLNSPALKRLEAMDEKTLQRLAVVAALRAFVMCLAVATRRPEMELIHWRDTHYDIRAIILVLVDAYRDETRAQFSRAHEFERLQTPKHGFSLTLHANVARLAIENAFSTNRQASIDALKFAAFALMRLPKSKTEDEIEQEAIANLAASWAHITSHAEDDAEDLTGTRWQRFLDQPLFDQSWLDPELMFVAQMAVSRNYNDPETGPRFSFWRSWYLDRITGKPIDWDLLEQIANLPEDTWEGGVEALESAIEHIQAEHLVQRSALAEDVFYNEATVRVARSHVPMRQPTTMATLLGALRDALEDAAKGNGLTEGTFEYRTLERMMSKYAHNPERVEMDVIKVWGSLQRQMNDKHLPDTPELMGLCDTLDETRREIHALHPEIKAARARRMVEGMRGASDDERDQMRGGLGSIHAVVDAEFADEIVEDLEQIIDGNGDVDAATRAGNRLAKTWLVLKAAVAGTGVSAGAIVAVEQALPVLRNLWQILSRLLGIG